MNDSQPSRDSPPSYPNQVRRQSSVASFVEIYSDHENDFLLSLAQEVLDDSSDDEDHFSWSAADGSDAGCAFPFDFECPSPSKQVSFGDVTVYESLSEQTLGAYDSTEAESSTSITTISIIQHETARFMRSLSPARKQRDKSSPCEGWAMSKQQHDQLFTRRQGLPIEAAPTCSTRKNWWHREALLVCKRNGEGGQK